MLDRDAIDYRPKMNPAFVAKALKQRDRRRAENRAQNRVQLMQEELERLRREVRAEKKNKAAAKKATAEMVQDRFSEWSQVPRAFRVALLTRYEGHTISEVVRRASKDTGMAISQASVAGFFRRNGLQFSGRKPGRPRKDAR